MARTVPLAELPIWAILGALALAILGVYALGRGRRSIWPATTIRILAAAGIIVPGMTILGWYRQLRHAREWTRELPFRPEPVVEMFLTHSVALLSAGFFLLIGGIYLARRLPDRPPRQRARNERRSRG
ncbi:MAG TPA: hypothetical protein VM737_10020 [Gemmatimonadota bacterium]|nr:hypothetical protein [Gemmatimonadota bacterium]